jgi:biopolymer transport protein ExbD
MARLASPRLKVRPRLEIIPFIDIMFFLLATFIMVSLKLIQNHAIPVHLPKASSAITQPRHDEVDLTVDEKGDLFWNKEPLTFEALPVRLESLKQAQTDPHIFINGDEKANFGRAVQVLDCVRTAGITSVAIETGKKPSEPSSTTP